MSPLASDLRKLSDEAAGIVGNSLRGRGTFTTSGIVRVREIVREAHDLGHPGDGPDEYLSVLTAKIRKTHEEAGTWADDKGRRGILTGLVLARELYVRRGQPARPFSEAVQEALQAACEPRGQS